MFTGSITALITPFKDGMLDIPAFDNLVEWQIEQGVHGLVPCGTTGESPTLSHDEHMAIIERTIQVSSGRVPVIAGTGSNSTQEAIMLTQHARDARADAALIVTPYYNKPTQEMMYAHFKAIHDAVDIPIILYNIPGRSIVDLGPEMMCKLAELDNIIGVKDATGDLYRPLEMRVMTEGTFNLLSGDDGTSAAFLAQGGHGTISVLSNVAPKECAQMHDAWKSGNMADFAGLRDALSLLANDLFCESSPAPVKYAASKLGLCSDEVRLPLLPASEAARAKVDAAMKHAGLV